MNFWLLIGALNGFIAVAAGAFGAHGLEGRVDSRFLAAFQTGAQYHLVHALAIIAAGHAARLAQPRRANAAGWLFFSGIVLFSGSLYFMGLAQSYALVLLTPIGGVLLLAGWIALAYAALRARA
jgi:uncharacterized membrane protein YgdD (TMEM256/DUF423 family)